MWKGAASTHSRKRDIPENACACLIINPARNSRRRRSIVIRTSMFFSMLSLTRVPVQPGTRIILLPHMQFCRLLPRVLGSQGRGSGGMMTNGGDEITSRRFQKAVCVAWTQETLNADDCRLSVLTSSWRYRCRAHEYKWDWCSVHVSHGAFLLCSWGSQIC